MGCLNVVGIGYLYYFCYSNWECIEECVGVYIFNNKGILREYFVWSNFRCCF